MALILPEHYDPHLDVRKTNEAIKSEILSRRNLEER